MQDKVMKVIFVVVFFAAMITPLVNMLFSDGDKVLNLEKRTVVKPPKLEIQNLEKFPRQFEKYFSDSFGFRNFLIDLNNRVSIKWFKTSTTPKVIVGKQGWLFYRSERSSDGNTIADYQGLAPFSARQLHRIKLNIEEKAAWFSKRKIHFLIVLIPNKETVYSEYLPDYIKRGKTTRLDQIEALVRRHPHLPVINLKSVLMKRKKTTRIYYKGGTHWNQYGAYWGCMEIIRRLSHWYPDIRIIPLQAYRPAINPRSSKDHWFGFKENRFVQLTLKPGYKSKINDYTLFAFRDSFLRTSPHFFKDHFRTYKEFSTRAIEQNLKVVEIEKPDIVIWEMVERCSDILLYLK